jgi:hypothetical protein
LLLLYVFIIILCRGADEKLLSEHLLISVHNNYAVVQIIPSMIMARSHKHGQNKSLARRSRIIVLPAHWTLLFLCTRLAHPLLFTFILIILLSFALRSLVILLFSARTHTQFTTFHSDWTFLGPLLLVVLQKNGNNNVKQQFLYQLSLFFGEKVPLSLLFITLETLSFVATAVEWDLFLLGSGSGSSSFIIEHKKIKSLL